MPVRTPVLAACTILTLSALAPLQAVAAEIDILSAEIAGGKLVVTGTTAAPNMRVRLDGRGEAGFNVTSNARGEFRLSVVYLPSDCVVALQRLTPPAALGRAEEAVVANCALGFSPRGEWDGAASYQGNDVVTHDGSTWLARRANRNERPGGGSGWQLAALGGSEAAGQSRAVPSGPAGGDLSGTYPDPTIRNGAVTTADLEAGAVTTAKIANGDVTAAKIAGGAVGTGEILDGAVGAADLAADAVTSVAILNNTLTADDLATDSVNASEIADNSIDSGEIVADSLFASDLGADSVTASELANNAVASANIIDGAVTSADVATNTLTLSDLAGGNVNGSISLAAGSVPNGRCEQYSSGNGGVLANDVVILSTRGALQQGIIIYAQRAPSDGQVTVNVCNFSGTTQAAITNLPVHVASFR